MADSHHKCFLAYTVPIAAVESQVVQSHSALPSSTERDLLKIKSTLNFKYVLKPK
jgi:hypothetical protein